MIWCCPPVPPAARGLSPGRTRCTSVTATPPTRYIWDFYYTYRDNANWLVRRVMPHQIHKLRVWDKCAADRVDYFVANSHYIAQRIKKYYPPRCRCDLPLRPYQRGTPCPQGGLLSGGGPLYLVQAHRPGGGGPAPSWASPWWLSAPAARKPNSKPSPAPPCGFLGGGLSDAEGPRLLSAGQGLPLPPGEEDFGITPVEAQSAGTPVLAFGRGGACESVVDGKTRPVFCLNRRWIPLPSASGGLRPTALPAPPNRSATTAEAFRRRGLNSRSMITVCSGIGTGRPNCTTVPAAA